MSLHTRLYRSVLLTTALACAIGDHTFVKLWLVWFAFFAHFRHQFMSSVLRDALYFIQNSIKLTEARDIRNCEVQARTLVYPQNCQLRNELVTCS